MRIFQTIQFWEIKLTKNNILSIQLSFYFWNCFPETINWIADTFRIWHHVHHSDNFNKMVPILHVNDTGSIHIQNFYRWKKRKISFAFSFSTDNSFDTNRRSDDEITNIEMTEVFNCFLAIIDTDSNSEEIIFIFNLFKFLFVLSCIIRVMTLKFLYDALCIAIKRTQNQSFTICESFWIFLFPATIFMIYYVFNYKISKLLNSAFFWIFNMNIIFIAFNQTIPDIALLFRNIESLLPLFCQTSQIMDHVLFLNILSLFLHVRILGRKSQ